MDEKAAYSFRCVTNNLKLAVEQLYIENYPITGPTMLAIANIDLSLVGANLFTGLPELRANPVSLSP